MIEYMHLKKPSKHNLKLFLLELIISILRKISNAKEKEHKS